MESELSLNSDYDNDEHVFYKFIRFLDVYLPNRDKRMDEYIYRYKKTIEKLDIEFNGLNDDQRINLLLKDEMDEYCAQLIYNFMINKHHIYFFIKKK